MLPNLKHLREERGISQQKLADAVGVSQPSIYKYENMNVEPDIGILISLADYFGTSVDYIIGHTAERRPIERTESYHLNDDEAELVRAWRSMSAEGRDCLMHVAGIMPRK